LDSCFACTSDTVCDCPFDRSDAGGLPMQPRGSLDTELAVVKDGATRGRTKRENYRLEDRLM
jgi:hypothetical protein